MGLPPAKPFRVEQTRQALTVFLRGIQHWRWEEHDGRLRPRFRLKATDESIAQRSGKTPHGAGGGARRETVAGFSGSAALIVRHTRRTRPFDGFDKLTAGRLRLRAERSALRRTAQHPVTALSSASAANSMNVSETRRSRGLPLF
jgi:hypothetical protein